MDTIYKLHYVKNKLNGFYHEEIHGENIPTPNMALNEELWQELLKKEYQLKDFNKILEKNIYTLEDINLFKEVIREPEPHMPSEIEKRLEFLETENADLLIDAAVKDAKINLLENDLADVMLEIAMMNIGGIK